VPVDDSYTAAGYRWLSIRSNDGGHRDAHFAQNYAWCVKACDDGRIAGFIVYFYWRPGATDVDTHMAMVEAAGGPHPQMVSMMDIESGGNPGGDQSPELTAEYDKLAAWLGDQRRVIAYANLGDEKTMWQFKPAHVPFILAGYGNNPTDPAVFKLAHQYTDGTGLGGGLPEGAPPFGNCDMNSADGFTPTQLAAACGIATTTGDDFMATINQDDANAVVAAARKILGVWGSRSIYRDNDNPIDDTVGMLLNIDATTFDLLTENQAMLGDPAALARVKRLAAGQGPAGNIPAAVARANFILTKIPKTAAAKAAPRKKA
jgi:hypothetical protein